MAELVPVLHDKTDKSKEVATITRFRNTIMKLKSSIYDSLEESIKDKHDIDKLDEATNRVIHLGNILALLLNGKYEPLDYDKETNSSIQSIKHLFEENGVEFESMDEEKQRECKQILEYDIYWFPYSLSNEHTKSLVKSRGS